MRYKIGNERIGKPEPEVRLELLRDADGNVNLMADGWYILSFESSGIIKRCGSVPSELGFKVDERGHVEMRKELARE